MTPKIELPPVDAPRAGPPWARADEIRVSAADVDPADWQRLCEGYAALGEFEDAAATCAAAGDAGVAAFREAVDRLDPARLLRAFDGLGRSEPPADPARNLRVRRAWHDLRGNALTGLIVHLELVQDGLGQPRDLFRAHLLARDHRKIMRHFVPELDPERHVADLAPKEHRIELIEEKWRGAVWGGRSVQVDSSFRGVISERCFEFAAIDRVIYNLVSNAARHGEGERIVLRLEPLPLPADVILRGSVESGLGSSAREALRSRFGRDLRLLFQGGFTTGGTGLGLQICAELVTHAFGLGDPMVAVDHALVGAAASDDTFVTWFCWPAREDHRAPPT